MIAKITTMFINQLSSSANLLFQEYLNCMVRYLSFKKKYNVHKLTSSPNLSADLD
jgi:hypothetical protein